MIYPELVDPPPSEKTSVACHGKKSQESGERTRASDERRLRFSEVAGAVGPRPALRLLNRIRTTS